MSKNFLSGMGVSLILALYKMLKLRVCRKKIPCFRKDAQEKASSMFENFWGKLSFDEKEEFKDRLMQCLYWRSLMCFESFDHFQSSWNKNFGIEQGFEAWIKTRRLDKEKPLKLVLRILRCRKIPLSKNEVVYCLTAIKGKKNEAINLAYKLILRGCHKVEIIIETEPKGLEVVYIEGERPVFLEAF